MNMSERHERLNRMIESGDVIRGEWTEGQHRACLLAALSPECGEAESASACPAELMPAWLAELTPWLDDEGSEEAWPGLIRRYARCAPRFHKLTDRTLWRVLATIVREAMRHTTDNSALEVCERVAGLYEHAASTGSLDNQAMREAAESVAKAAAAGAAARVAWAAEAAARVAWAAESVAKAAARAAMVAAREAVVDRLQDAIMTIIEQDCGVEE